MKEGLKGSSQQQITKQLLKSSPVIEKSAQSSSLSKTPLHVLTRRLPQPKGCIPLVTVPPPHPQLERGRMTELQYSDFASVFNCPNGVSLSYQFSKPNNLACMATYTECSRCNINLSAFMFNPHVLYPVKCCTFLTCSIFLQYFHKCIHKYRYLCSPHAPLQLSITRTAVVMCGLCYSLLYSRFRALVPNVFALCTPSHEQCWNGRLCMYFCHRSMSSHIHRECDVQIATVFRKLDNQKTKPEMTVYTSQQIACSTVLQCIS